MGYGTAIGFGLLFVFIAVLAYVKGRASSRKASEIEPEGEQPAPKHPPRSGPAPF